MAAPSCLRQGELRLLDPKSVRIERDAFRRVRLCIGFEERYEPVHVVRCLPLTEPDRFLSLQDEEGEEIGIIEDPSGLDPDSLRVVEEELDLGYLNAEVRRILKVIPRQGLVSWEVDTDLGPRTVYIKDRSDIRPLPDGRIILTDVYGAKYQIPALEQLDEQSRSWLEIEM